MQKPRFAITTSGWVKSTTACAPESTRALLSSPASSAATRVNPSAASTALHISAPTLPCAPSTPIFAISPVTAPNLRYPRPLTAQVPAGCTGLVAVLFHGLADDSDAHTLG